MPRIERQNRRRLSLASIERPMAVSYGLLAAIVILGAIGYALDRTLNTAPWLLIGGVLAGLVVGFYALGHLMRSP